MILASLSLAYVVTAKLPKGRLILTEFLEYQMSRIFKISTPEGEVKFLIPNWLTFYRADTLLTKEPETISWIRGMNSDEIFWDIGANVGTYTIFAANRGLHVVAFEPSFLNLEILCRNVIVNNLQNHVDIVPIALDSQVGINKLFMSRENMLIGGAHNSIRLQLNQFGKKLENFQIVNWPSISLDKMVDVFQLPYPSYLKIDVDGCELEILQGGRNVLRNVSSILVEMHEENPSSKRIADLLQKLGFNIQVTESFNSFNQIWTKP